MAVSQGGDTFWQPDWKTIAPGRRASDFTSPAIEALTMTETLHTDDTLRKTEGRNEAVCSVCHYIILCYIIQSQYLCKIQD